MHSLFKFLHEKQKRIRIQEHFMHSDKQYSFVTTLGMRIMVEVDWISLKMKVLCVFLLSLSCLLSRPLPISPDEDDAVNQKDGLYFAELHCRLNLKKSWNFP